MTLTIFPRRISWVFGLLLFFLISMMLLRGLFFLHYRHQASAPVFPAFWMGFRFDLKFASIAGLFFLLFSIPPFLDPFKGKRAYRFWLVLLTLIWFLLLLLYAVDYYHYDYLHQRLNASVLNYLQDAGISMAMVGQSYPVIPVTLILLVLLLAGFFIFRQITRRAGNLPHDTVKRPGLFVLGQFLLLGAFIFGKPGQYNLRWSDAFTVGDNFSAQLALNPIQSFFSTLKYRSSGPDMVLVKKQYPLVAGMLGIEHPDTADITYSRKCMPAFSPPVRPNIVLVVCESFSSYKSSCFGNPLSTTPFFDSLAGRGLLFDRCFTPAYGTARGVWALVTGIPDVEEPRTASRNPANVNQHTLINDFDGYEKYYFLGGNPSWANIQGLLSSNIGGLKMFMQYDFKSPKIDVWGISDHDLFREAGDMLKKEDKPFFAIIQTADNHRPYTIPEEDAAAIGLQEKSMSELRQAGFESNEEFNAFRYTDYCFRKFIEAASSEKYFTNTIFVFIGDHGIRGNAGKIFPESWTQDGLTCEHVPLLFYSPLITTPARSSRVCSQVDVLPSLASLAGLPYVNTALGRDLFSPLDSSDQTAFIFDVDMHTIGTINGSHYYYRNLKTGVEKTVSVTGGAAASTQAVSSVDRLRNQTEGWYQASKYLLRNNGKPEN